MLITVQSCSLLAFLTNASNRLKKAFYGDSLLVIGSCNRNTVNKNYKSPIRMEHGRISEEFIPGSVNETPIRVEAVA